MCLSKRTRLRWCSWRIMRQCVPGNASVHTSQLAWCARCWRTANGGIVCYRTSIRTSRLGRTLRLCRIPQLWIRTVTIAAMFSPVRSHTSNVNYGSKLYHPVWLSHFLHSLGNYTRRAIFPELCKINQSRVGFHCKPFVRLIDWLTISSLWLDWFIGFVPPDLFLRGRGLSDST